MSDNETPKGKAKAARGKDYGPVVDSEAALKEVKKPDDKASSFVITLGGKVYAMHANDRGMAAVRLVKHLGGAIRRLGSKPVDKNQLAAGLAALSPEDRAVLIAAYVPAPAPAPAGKGKKQ